MRLLKASANALPLDDESVQTCVTSPPYWGLRQYAGEQTVEWGDGTTHALGLEPTPELYVAHMVEVFREVRRVLRPDGTLWMNLGDSYWSDTLIKGQPAWSKWETGGLKTGQEVTDGKGARPGGLKPKDLVGIPWMVAFALRADGWYLRSDIIWHKPNPMPESVTDRPTKSHEYLFLLSKSERYFYDGEAIKEPAGPFHAAGKNTRADVDRDARHGTRKQDALGKQTYTGFNARWRENPTEGRNKRTVWTVATRPYSGAHFATYPEDLIEPCILAGSAVGDTVLDPFNGSGTTGVVAVRHNREYVGVDISDEYLDLARERINNVQRTFPWEAA